MHRRARHAPRYLAQTPLTRVCYAPALVAGAGRAVVCADPGGEQGSRYTGQPSRRTLLDLHQLSTAPFALARRLPPLLSRDRGELRRSACAGALRGAVSRGSPQHVLRGADDLGVARGGHQLAREGRRPEHALPHAGAPMLCTSADAHCRAHCPSHHHAQCRAPQTKLEKPIIINGRPTYRSIPSRRSGFRPVRKIDYYLYSTAINGYVHCIGSAYAYGTLSTS